MTTAYPLTLFYDAACPICALEMDHLRQRDLDHHLRLVDISAADFDPARHGLSAPALDAEMHALWADGSLLRGLAALRVAYPAVGLGWLLRPTGASWLRPVFDAAYRTFARHRRPISRALAPCIEALAARRADRVAARLASCAGGACAAVSKRARPVSTGRAS
ncbi:MAG: DUF393 domain-containing protein [Caldimonas sp.]